MKYILPLVLFLSMNTVFAKQGDEVRNGGGLAESYLAFALQNLNQTIDLCLSQTECGKRNEGREVLKKIKASLPTELANDLLKFSSNAKNPGFFIVDGYVRLAVTGSNVGNPIYYNLDLLYQNSEVKINYGQAVQSLIHELAHHHGFVNHDQLDSLGADVRNSIEGSVSEAAYLPHLNNQGFFSIGTEMKSFENSGSLILLFRDKTVNLTSQFDSLLNECNSDATSSSPVKSKAIQFFNTHWNPASFASLNSDKVLSGNVILYCQHQYLKSYRKFYEFSIGVKIYFATSYNYVDSHFVSKPKYIFSIL